MKFQTKLLLGVGIAILVTFTLVEIGEYQRAREMMLEDARNTARDIRGVLMSVRRVYQHQFLESGMTLSDETLGFLPAHALSRISSEFGNWSESGISFNNVSDRPRNPKNQADEAEIEAIHWFRENSRASERLILYDNPRGADYLHYSTPIWVVGQCLECHGTASGAPDAVQERYDTAFGYSEGQLRGIMSIKIPLELLEVRLNKSWQDDISGHAVAFVAAFLIGALLLRFTVTSKLRQFIGASSQVAEGDYSARIDAKGADELSLLGRTFNRMAEALLKREQQLKSHRDQLDQLLGEQQLLLANSNDFVYRHDLDGNFTYVSPAIERISGYTPEQWRSHNRDYLTSNPVNLVLGQRVKEAFDSGVAQPPYLMEIRHCKGHPVMLEVNEQPLLESGRVIGMVGVARDVTERLAAQQAIEKERLFLQNVIDGTADPIMVIGLDYRVQLMNRSAAASMNTSRLADPEAPKCYEVSHHRTAPCDGKCHPCPLAEVMDTGKTSFVMHDHPDEEGHSRYYELAATPLRDADGDLQGIIEVSRDMTMHYEVQAELQEKQTSLNHMAHHDALTDLPNRVLFLDRLEQAIGKAQRTQTQLAVLFIDLDRFKGINDSFGHATGDQVLKQVAVLLRESVRETDTVARLGGDEFIVIMDAMRESRFATGMAQKLNRVLQSPIEVHGQELYVTSSIGISLYPQDGMDSETLLRNADAAMYKAKDEGRNTFQFYSRQLTDRAFERVSMESQLRRALTNEEFLLHYQPQVDLSSGALVGLEALVRWNHPDKGLISPDRFIPLAEDTGLILPLGEWVLGEACRQACEWREAGLSPGRVAVNLAGKELQRKGYLEHLLRILDRYNCRPEWLCLEVTEGFLMDHPGQSIAALQDLRSAGIELAIDDFGTGYSSLSYLKKLPITKLKIDRSFVRDIPDDANDMAITRAVIALGRSMNLRLVAEGVETDTQRMFLKIEGCHEAQGYLFSRPMGREATTDYLSKESD